MRPLEEIAKRLFEQFAIQETGRQALWAYLNKERQKAWKKDVLLIANYVLSEVKKDIPKIENVSKINTSYVMGFTEGRKSEQQRIFALISGLQQDLNDQMK